MAINMDTIERLRTKLKATPPKTPSKVRSSREAVLLLRTEIERLRASGHDWSDVAELLKDDGQGGGIAVKGATIKAALAVAKPKEPRRSRKAPSNTGHIAGL